MPAAWTRSRTSSGSLIVGTGRFRTSYSSGLHGFGATRERIVLGMSAILRGLRHVLRSVYVRKCIRITRNCFIYAGELPGFSRRRTFGGGRAGFGGSVGPPRRVHRGHLREHELSPCLGDCRVAARRAVEPASSIPGAASGAKRAPPGLTERGRLNRELEVLQMPEASLASSPTHVLEENHEPYIHPSCMVL